ncbi:HNH endonuclease [Anatilimnocola floriformis]|uniref:HNH endonuclease n=1 Tax=Anatilimnocola floriformis TaxID=2948575 RepID=UPI0036F37395
MTVPSVLARLVRDRAGSRCEYCQFPQAFSSIPFEIDHVIARKHHGLTEAENLALSCFFCNSAKGPNIAGVDPESGAIVPLYHPRRESWSVHFRWKGAELIGLTPAGRATIDVLSINEPNFLILRESLLAEGQTFTAADPP